MRSLSELGIAPDLQTLQLAPASCQCSDPQLGGKNGSRAARLMLPATQQVVAMNQPYAPTQEDWVDQEVRHSLRVIRRQRAAKLAGVAALAILAAIVLILTTYLGLTR